MNRWDSANGEWVEECLPEGDADFDEYVSFPDQVESEGGSSSGGSSSSDPSSCVAFADETVVPAADITIEYLDSVITGGKEIKRDVRESFYKLGGDVGKQHRVLVPFRISVKVPEGKTARFYYEVQYANIESVRGMGAPEVLKRVTVKSGEFETTGNGNLVGLADYSKIKDLYEGGAGGPPADHLGAGNRYGVMIMVRQLKQDPDTGKWDRYYLDSQAYKSIFMTKTDPPPAVTSDNTILKP